MKREITLKSFEEVLEREVNKFGNGSHITLPKKHTGKKAVIVIKEQ